MRVLTNRRISIGKFWPKVERDPVRANLKSLSSKLSALYQREVKRLLNSQGTLAETDAVHIVLRHLNETKAVIEAMSSNGAIGDATRYSKVLAERKTQLRSLIQTNQLDTYYYAGATALAALNLLFLAEDGGTVNGNGIVPIEKTSSAESTTIAKMGIHSDLLYQMRHQLFPAERMLVASGKRRTEGIDIRAVFEVTGQATVGHVRAEPDKLGQALISMDLTETYFALWVHSHPGTGKACTYPSDTDIRQHADWLQHYSPDLVSAIMVRDGWIRFWGTAVESGRLHVEVVGPGVKKEEEMHETIFRLEC